MGNYSSDPSSCRVDFFTSTGDWLSTRAVVFKNVRNTGKGNIDIVDQLKNCILDQLGERFSEKIAVCLKPHSYSCSPIILIPDSIKLVDNITECFVSRVDNYIDDEITKEIVNDCDCNRSIGDDIDGVIETIFADTSSTGYKLVMNTKSRESLCNYLVSIGKLGSKIKADYLVRYKGFPIDINDNFISNNGFYFTNGV
jgi:hypothetical protein